LYPNRRSIANPQNHRDLTESEFMRLIIQHVAQRFALDTPPS